MTCNLQAVSGLATVTLWLRDCGIGRAKANANFDSALLQNREAVLGPTESLASKAIACAGTDQLGYPRVNEDTHAGSS